MEKSIIENAPDGSSFYAIDGNAINNLVELADAFGKMSDDTFYYHVGNGRNDFSTWIKDIFQDEQLANEIGSLNNRAQAENHLLRYLLKALLK